MRFQNKRTITSKTADIDLAFLVTTEKILILSFNIFWQKPNYKLFVRRKKIIKKFQYNLLKLNNSLSCMKNIFRLILF